MIWNLLNPNQSLTMSLDLWRNRSARSAVHRKIDGSSPPREFIRLSIFTYVKKNFQEFNLVYSERYRMHNFDRFLESVVVGTVKDL